MPSLEELEAMGDEDEEGADAVAEDILNSILEDEESGELNAWVASLLVVMVGVFFFLLPYSKLCFYLILTSIWWYM